MDPWIIHKNNLGIWAEQRSILDNFVRTCSIAYNSAYGVPVLWFNLYDS
uniref:Uncharacterized protein n=1 Tax=Acrobeloides nanus TaxID=290746 RepID=A0A914D9Y5_9BILA